MDHDRAALLDRRPLYPEVVAFGAPRGFRERIKDHARQQGTTVSALVRQALEPVLAKSAEPQDATR